MADLPLSAAYRRPDSHSVLPGGGDPSAHSPGATQITPAPSAAPRLLDRVKERIRYLHYSLRTEEAYVHWVKAFMRCHGLRHPKGMGQSEVQAFLQCPSADRHVSASVNRYRRVAKPQQH